MLKYEGYINKTYKEVEKMKKLESKWEEPTKDEVDVIHKVDRTKSIKK